MDPALAREAFGPLGGLVEIGAVSEAGSTQPLNKVSVAAFVSRHRGELNQILDTVRAIGNFDAATMAVSESLGWFKDHEITSASLLMWSGCIDEYSAALDHPTAVRRMLRMGSDLQLVQLFHALVRIGAAHSMPTEGPSRRIESAITLAARLGGNQENNPAWNVFRMWRVKFLPSTLMPSSSTPPDEKARIRGYAHSLEALIENNP
ncbi:hypothetical protein ABTX82_34875 [Streptomyces lavendulae]|uniref:hypothetical protein n=1 Tax=Streptomyces lavendulae TaxID=1914 RepID=UPI003325769F